MRTRAFLVSLLLSFLAAVSSVSAQEIFVRNQPFKGPTQGLGEELSFSLPHLAQALGVEAMEGPEGWLMGGEPVRTRQEGGVTWIRLQDVPPALVRIERNAELQTLDIYLAEAVAEGPGVWSSKNRLIFFGAGWCPACHAMAPALGDFRSTGAMEVIYIDIDQPKHKDFKKFVRHFRGDKIPYFVVLDKKKNRRKHSFDGFRTYTELLKELKPYL